MSAGKLALAYRAVRLAVLLLLNLASGTLIADIGKIQIGSRGLFRLRHRNHCSGCGARPLWRPLSNNAGGLNPTITGTHDPNLVRTAKLGTVPMSKTWLRVTTSPEC
jgi:hypothetical protein